jgi:hypothetical protein
VHSPAAGLTPVESARYLGVVLLSLPAALWPAWRLARSCRLAVVPVAGLVAATVAATVALVPQVPAYRRFRADQVAVVGALRDAGLNYVQAEYWTCAWITYLSDERIICGVVRDDMTEGRNRYPAYWREERTPQAWLAPVGHPLDLTLARRLQTAPETVGLMHIYRTAHGR